MAWTGRGIDHLLHWSTHAKPYQVQIKKIFFSEEGIRITLEIAKPLKTEDYQKAQKRNCVNVCYAKEERGGSQRPQ